MGYLENHMLSAGEVAELLNVPIRVVYKHINKGNLVPDAVLGRTKDGRSGMRKFKRSTIQAFAASPAFRGC